jgi:glutathione S-transferase
MLELKHIEFTLVNVMPFNQRVHLRLAGFRGGTVPALKIDGRRVQGSREIARVLDEEWSDSPLVPADPAERARVLEAERWGEETLQPIPRRLARFGVAGRGDLRRWAAEQQRLPAARLMALLSAPIAWYYTRTVELDGRRANEAGVRADLRALSAVLDRVDQLLADGTLTTDPPNAATLQILASVRLLAGFADLREQLDRPCGTAALQLFPRYRVSMPPFLPKEWLPTG